VTGSEPDSAVREESMAMSGGTLSYLVAGSGTTTVVLLHGWPETRACWRAVAPVLAAEATVLVPDLPGYGRSSAPATGMDKRSMAEVLAELVDALDTAPVMVAGHDRGARVAHRWALDRPDQIARLAVLDVLPMREVLGRLDAANASTYWHWYFHALPDVPERVIAGDVAGYLRRFLSRLQEGGNLRESEFQHYVAAYSAPDRIRNFLEDYRAGFREDLALDEADHTRGDRLVMPLLALWGAEGSLAAVDVLSVWGDYAPSVAGTSIDGGHYLPEERPAEVASALREFFFRGRVTPGMPSASGRGDAQAAARS
jgi:pimeloyl-ACP methyl ester carboxylesterase